MSVERARDLRANMTDAERKLWSRLRRKQVDGHRFRRQVPIGPYVVDFACLASRLIIEVDGGQHSENIDRDARRTNWLESQNFRVVRFWNNDVLGNIDAVMQTIERTLQFGPPPPLRGRSATRSVAGWGDARSSAQETPRLGCNPAAEPKA